MKVGSGFSMGGLWGRASERKRCGAESWKKWLQGWLDSNDKAYSRWPILQQWGELGTWGNNVSTESHAGGGWGDRMGKTHLRIIPDLEARDGQALGSSSHAPPHPYPHNQGHTLSLLGWISCFLNLIFLFLCVCNHFGGVPSLVVCWKEIHKR